MCLKNTEILKIYASKILLDKNLENEFKLLERILKDADCSIDQSIILIKKCASNSDGSEEMNDLENNEHKETAIKCEINSSVTDEVEINCEDSEPMCLENKIVSRNQDVNINNSIQEVSVIKQNLNSFVEPSLKLESVDEDESYSEDQGDESMDCDEQEREDVISINDSENDNIDEESSEPMNLTSSKYYLKKIFITYNF